MPQIFPRLLYLAGTQDFDSVDSFERHLRGLLDAGLPWFQLRDKRLDDHALSLLADRVRLWTRERGTLFTLNDRSDIALLCEADGVHLGQEDLSLEEARKLLGDAQLIGKSTHSLEQAIAADREGADYLAVGPIFATPTKPEARPVGLSWIREVRERVGKPFFCIGGIRKENLIEVLDAGADRVVMVSAILHAPDIEGYCREVAAMLGPKNLLADEPEIPPGGLRRG